MVVTIKLKNNVVAWIKELLIGPIAQRKYLLHISLQPKVKLIS